MVTTMATATTAIMTTSQPTTNIPTSETTNTANTTRQRIMGRLNTAMHHQGEGSGGGNPGGSGGGGGGGPALAPPAANPAALVAPAANVRSMGTLPAIFTGNRTKAQDFLDELRSYFRANQGVTGFDSFIGKVSIALTLIKGPAVTGWTHSMGDWIDGLDPLQDDYEIV
jgi:hypothetical protein